MRRSPNGVYDLITQVRAPGEPPQCKFTLIPKVCSHLLHRCSWLQHAITYCTAAHCSGFDIITMRSHSAPYQKLRELINCMLQPPRYRRALCIWQGTAVFDGEMSSMQGDYIGIGCADAKGRYLQGRKRGLLRFVFYSDHCGIWEQWKVQDSPQHYLQSQNDSAFAILLPLCRIQ